MALVNLSIDTLQIPPRKPRWLVATIKVFEVITDVYTIDALENVLMFEKKITQPSDWVGLIQLPIRYTNMAAKLRQALKVGLSRSRIASDLQQRIAHVVNYLKHFLINSRTIVTFLYQVALPSEVIRITGES